MFLGFPKQTWIILGVEFAERMGYYAVAFSLFTYCTNMLLTGASMANVIVNLVYVIVPTAACISSGLADGRWGRPYALARFMCTYAAGLVLLALSALPFAYDNFPYNPRLVSYFLCAMGLTCFGIGYGGMKVCTNPIMADSVTCMYRDRLPDEPAPPLPPAAAAREASHPDSARLSTACAGANGDVDADAPTKPTADGGVAAAAREELDGLAAARAEELRECLARLFQYIYWVTNCGALIGIFAAPLFRNLDSRRKAVGSELVTTGYYYSFFMAAAAVCCGLVFFLVHYRRFPTNPPAPSFVFFRVLLRAAWTRVLFATGRIRDEQFAADATDLFSFALYRSPEELQATAPQHYASVEEVGGRGDGGDDDLEEVVVGTWLDDCRATVAVCRTFVALPVYWLICNQFSTNLMYQASALRLASWVPPEMFNNINTFTVLIFLIVYDKLILPHVFQGTPPEARLRVLVGFCFMTGCMVWCALVQVAIAARGSYDSSDAYVLAAGRQKLSAGWLVPPYVAQGLAAALVDTAVMEIAYVDAPARMKGTVMGLYWVASSCSGWAGIIMSPVMRPQFAVGLFFFFAAAQVAVTFLFRALNH